MRTRSVVALSVFVVLGLAACGKKSTNPAPQGITNEWPQDATGTYEVQIEVQNCTLFGCRWDTVNVLFDTLGVCPDGMPFPAARTDSSAGFYVNEEEGIVSDSVVDVTYRGQMTLQNDCLADFTTTISSRETDQPFSRDGWQLIITTRISGCGITATPGKTRFTYRRIGDSCQP